MKYKVKCLPCKKDMTPPVKNHWICPECEIKFPIRLIYLDQIPSKPAFALGRIRNGANWHREERIENAYVMIEEVE